MRNNTDGDNEDKDKIGISNSYLNDTTFLLSKSKDKNNLFEKEMSIIFFHLVVDKSKDNDNKEEDTSIYSNDSKNLVVEEENNCISHNETSISLYIVICLINSSMDIEDLNEFSIIIDTGSSASIFKNEELVEDVSLTRRALRLITNGRGIRDRMTRTFQGMKV